MRTLGLLSGCLLLASACDAQFARIVVEGDSLFSVNNTLPNWTMYFEAPVTMVNRAQGLSTFPMIIGRFFFEDSLYAGDDAAFILEGGINDLANLSQTGGEVYSNALRILAMAQMAGFASNYLCTVAPSSCLTPPMETERLNYNALVVSGASNGYTVIDINAVISQDTEDTQYYQGDGLHWTQDFEKWLGVTVIADVLGVVSNAPALSIQAGDGFVTISWAGRSYATNQLQQRETISGSWSNCVCITLGTNRPCSVQLTNHAPRMFYRLFTSHVDFPTLLALEH